MLIKVDDNLFAEISELHKKVICNDIHEDMWEADMKRRISHAVEEGQVSPQEVIDVKYKGCMTRLRLEWEPRFKKLGINFPEDDDAFAEQVFAHDSYKDRKARG